MISSTRRRFGTWMGLAAAVALTAGAMMATAAEAAPVVGQPAPVFTAVDTKGVSHSLSDFAGKTVVLEWTNHLCPFVVKHYEGSSNIPAQQKAAAEDGIVWLSVISSAPGKQGHLAAADADAKAAERGAAPAAILIDESGDMGRLYDAKTTPHMFVIDGDGVLRYQGAIDSVKSTRAADIEGADQYVEMALAAIAEGRAVDPDTTVQYGCSVKY